MSKTGEIPYTWEQIEDGIRAAIWAQASMLADFGPLNDLEMTARYLGLSEEPESFDTTEIPEFDLTRHALYHRVKAAYLYAYQLDGSESVAGDYDLYVDTITLLEGFPQAGHQADSSPLHPEVDAPLRRMLETFVARFGLMEPDCNADRSIRELALLANMTVPAVRTSLSKEGIKLEKSVRKGRDGQNEIGFRLNGDEALAWLSRRRGFIPQRAKVEETAAARIARIMVSDAGFPELFGDLVEANGTTLEALAQAAAVDGAWVETLAAGDHALMDIGAIRRVARALEAPEPEFAARAIQHLVKLDSAAS